MTQDVILLDYSLEKAALALDANISAFGAFLSTLPAAILHDEPGLLWFETGIAHDVFNGVLQTHISPEALPATIERMLTHFQQRHLPFRWHLGPCSQSTDFGD